MIPVFTKGGYRPGFWTVVSELRLINLARENENEMQISYYLLSRSKKPQIQFCFRNISSLIAKSPQHKISAQTAPLLQPEHPCTQGEGRSGVLRDISSPKGSLCAPISNPSCTCFDSLPRPPEPSTQLYTTQRWKQLPDFPGIFKTDKKS